MSPMSVALTLVLACAGRLPVVSAASLLRRGTPNKAETLQPKSSALLCGLTGHADLNGRKVRILRFNEDGGNYSVRVEASPGSQRAASFRASVAGVLLVPVPADSVPGCPTVAAPAAAVGAHSLAVHGHQGNLSSQTHPVVDRDIFHEGCSEACDDCIGQHGICEAKCHEGCQLFCMKSTAGMPGCSTEEYWSARPSSGGPPIGCTWDNGPNACNKWRNCQSQNEDGCPEAYLY